MERARPLEGAAPPVFSIVIPVRGPNADLLECLSVCARIEGPAFEIIVVTDEPWDDTPTPGVIALASGAVGPGAKRDLAAEHARGEILAFLDDDTIPERCWLHNAFRYFQDPTVVAVGGPAVTARADSPMRQASGYVYESLLGGGPYAYRYRPGMQRDVDDYPTCNLLVRRDAFLKVGGFDTAFWPGEDTKLCHDLAKLGGRIVYGPDVVVEHHRRPLFRPHLAQIRSYALHRGYFVKRFPATSLRPGYFAPSFLVIAATASLLVSIRVRPARRAVRWGGSLYLLGVAADALSVTRRRLSLWPLVAVGIVTTHVVYGLYFVLGLIQGRLPEE